MCKFGTVQVGELCKPSYSGIETVNRIRDPDNDLIHVVEITPDYMVLFNGAEIAAAPEPYTGKGKGRSVWTTAKRLQYCKAVIYSIIPFSIQGWDKTNRKAITVQDDAELRRYIALYPALISNQNAEMQQIMTDEMPVIIPPVLLSPLQLPEADFNKCFRHVADKTPVIITASMGLPEPDPVLTDEEINGYPIIDLMPDLESKISADIQEMDPKSNCCDPHYEGYDYPEYDNVTTEIDQSGNLKEMWSLINPIQVIRQWTYRGMQIREEALS
jgi:hypothetical protein